MKQRSRLEVARRLMPRYQSLSLSATCVCVYHYLASLTLSMYKHSLHSQVGCMIIRL